MGSGTLSPFQPQDMGQRGKKESHKNTQTHTKSTEVSDRHIMQRLSNGRQCVKAAGILVRQTFSEMFPCSEMSQCD